MSQSKARELLKNKFLEALKEGKIPWKCPWMKYQNGVSQHEYKGINKVLISYISMERGYTDPRFYTFNQIKEMKLHLSGESKGKGIPVEFWSLYDIIKKKTITIKEYEEKYQDKKEDVRWMVRNYYVFNAKYIEGLPEFRDNSLDRSYMESDHKLFLDNLVKNMGLTFDDTAGDSAYYLPSKDLVQLPPYNSFYIEEDYYETAFHEIAHATGHESRLNRDIKNVFGTIAYAKEELRAEIASTFLSADIGIFADRSIENHKGYIKSWIDILENQENELFKAIADAEKIVDYMKDKGEYEKIYTIQEEIENKNHIRKEDIGNKINTQQKELFKENKSMERKNNIVER